MRDQWKLCFSYKNHSLTSKFITYHLKSQIYIYQNYRPFVMTLMGRQFWFHLTRENQNPAKVGTHIGPFYITEKKKMIEKLSEYARIGVWVDKVEETVEDLIYREEERISRGKEKEPTSEGKAGISKEVEFNSKDDKLNPERTPELFSRIGDDLYLETKVEDEHTIYWILADIPHHRKVYEISHHRKHPAGPFLKLDNDWLQYCDYLQAVIVDVQTNYFGSLEDDSHFTWLARLRSTNNSLEGYPYMAEDHNYVGGWDPNHRVSANLQIQFESCKFLVDRIKKGETVHIFSVRELHVPLDSPNAPMCLGKIRKSIRAMVRGEAGLLGGGLGTLDFGVHTFETLEEAEKFLKRHWETRKGQYEYEDCYYEGPALHKGEIIAMIRKNRTHAIQRLWSIGEWKVSPGARERIFYPVPDVDDYVPKLEYDEGPDVSDIFEGCSPINGSDHSWE